MYRHSAGSQVTAARIATGGTEADGEDFIIIIDGEEGRNVSRHCSGSEFLAHSWVPETTEKVLLTCPWEGGG